MPIKEYVRTVRGERIDQPDYQHTAETGPKDTAAQVNEEVLVGRASTAGGTLKSQPDAFILEGFSVSVNALELTVNGGRAILSTRDERGQQNGNVISGGDSSKTIDMTSFPDAVNPDPYGVYIRFTLRESAFQNRLIWNSAAPTPVETPQNIGTRLTEAWDVVIEKVSPGPEWTLIWEIQKTGGALTETDKRAFFFEGDAQQSHLVIADEWGGNNDRDDDRALEGVFGLRRFVRGVQRQLESIIGGTDPAPRHWARAIDSAKGLFEMFARDGTRDLAGNFNPDGVDTREMGDLRRWLNILTKNATIELLTLRNKGTANDLIRRLLSTAQISSAGHPATETRNLIWEWQSFDTAGNNVWYRLYMGSGVPQYGSTSVQEVNTLELTCNAKWNESAPNDSWIPDTVGNRAYAIVLAASLGSISIQSKASAPAGGWRTDGALGDTWDNGNRGSVFFTDTHGLLLETVSPQRDPGLNASFPNATINKKNVPFAGGTLENSGGSLVFRSHWNCGFSPNGSSVDILFDTPASNDDYQVTCQIQSLSPFFGTAFGHLVVWSQTNAQFTISLYDIFNALLVDMNVIGANNLKFSFVVHGQV
jgi:hypothetical protein